MSNEEDSTKDKVTQLMEKLGLSSRQLQGAKLGPGVVGRNSTIAWSLEIVMLAGVICGGYLHSAALVGGSIVGAILVGLAVPWLNVSFAKENPAAALLEGAEFVEYHHMQVTASKTSPGPQISGPGVPAPKELLEGKRNSLPEHNP